MRTTSLLYDQMSVRSSSAMKWWDCALHGSRRGRIWGQQGSLHFESTKLLMLVTLIQNCRQSLWHGWSGVCREDRAMFSVRAEGCRGQCHWLVPSCLSPSCWLGCGLFTLPPVSPFCSSSAVSSSPCACPPPLSAYLHHKSSKFIVFWLLPSLCPELDSHTAHPSALWHACFLLFPPCSGATMDCIVTGRRNWLPSLFSWNTRSQGCAAVVFLELFCVAGSSLKMSWHTGVEWVCS